MTEHPGVAWYQNNWQLFDRIAQEQELANHWVALIESGPVSDGDGRILARESVDVLIAQLAERSESRNEQLIEIEAESGGFGPVQFACSAWALHFVRVDVATDEPVGQREDQT